MTRTAPRFLASFAAGFFLMSLGACDGAGSTERAGLTARAVAAVMLDHLPDDTDKRVATIVSERSPEGLVGAEFWYPPADRGLALHVTTSVRRGGDAYDAGCGRANCVELGKDTVLIWQDHSIEDSGIVQVKNRRGDEVVTVLVLGPEITGDPREMDLALDVDVLSGLAQDPRLQLTTTRAAVEAGARVRDWAGGEVDPEQLAIVPNNDRTVVMSWTTGYGDRRWLGPSPYKKLLGPHAVGGRAQVHPVPFGEVVIDALAAPEPPDWLGNACRPAGYRCDQVEGLTFIWRPAHGGDRGDAFVWLVRKGGETVGYHIRGQRLPDNTREAAGRAGVFWFGADLDYAEAVWPLGYTTSRRIFEEFDGPITPGR